MFDLREIGERLVWPDHLCPNGYGDHSVEPFEAWWEKHASELNHLPVEVVEQWVYRHWSASVSKFISLEDLCCMEKTWPASDFISKIGTVRGNEQMHPEHDYSVFSGQLDGRGKLSTATALDEGVWDFAPIVLQTLSGFIDTLGVHIDKPYFLVEGHKRRRYLNALLSRGQEVPDQRIFVLVSPTIG